jgi:hypothetical protein
MKAIRYIKEIWGTLVLGSLLVLAAILFRKDEF